ncbi:DUF6228 family protein [Streptomyces sp. NPDC001523]|uniref:DUF6228 family protein n=1 Tax=Streptomyces sp. NPDC001523 TaxID=3154383 RepID=UPI003333539C
MILLNKGSDVSPRTTVRRGRNHFPVDARPCAPLSLDWSGERNRRAGNRDLVVSAAFHSVGYARRTGTVRPWPKTAAYWSATVAPTTTRLDAGERMPCLKSGTRCLPGGRHQ